MAGSFESSVSSVNGKYMSARHEQFDMIPRRAAELKAAEQLKKEEAHRKVKESDKASKKAKPKEVKQNEGLVSGNDDSAIQDYFRQQTLEHGHIEGVMGRANYGKRT